MSADRREDLRAAARDLLDFQPEESLPCNRVLGIGLVEEVCENDESLKRWLVCQAVEFAVDEDRDIEDAMAEAFDMAEDQCEFFDLEFPRERPTSFGPLQAQEVREQRRATTEQTGLPGVEPEREEEPPTLEPQRVEAAPRGEQTGLGGPAREETARATERAAERQRRAEREAERETPREQERLGGAERPARISEFAGGSEGGEAPEGEPAPGWETGTSPSGHFVAEGTAPAGVNVIVAVRRGEAVDTATGRKIELETIVEVGNEVAVMGTHRSTAAAERQAREIIEDSPGDVAMRPEFDSGNGSPRRRR